MKKILLICDEYTECKVNAIFCDGNENKIREEFFKLEKSLRKIVTNFERKNKKFHHIKDYFQFLYKKIEYRDTFFKFDELITNIKKILIEGIEKMLKDFRFIFGKESKMYCNVCGSHDQHDYKTCHEYLIKEFSDFIEVVRECLKTCNQEAVKEFLY